MEAWDIFLLGHTAYGSLGYLFGPNVWLLLYLVLLKWDIPRCERHLFAPWVVPVLGGPWAVGFPSGALPHRLGPVCAPLPLRLGSICTGGPGLHSPGAHLLLPGAKVELTLCDCKGEECRQCEDDQPHDDGAAALGFTPPGHTFSS